MSHLCQCIGIFECAWLRALVSAHSLQFIDIVYETILMKIAQASPLYVLCYWRRCSLALMYNSLSSHSLLVGQDCESRGIRICCGLGCFRPNDILPSFWHHGRQVGQHQARVLHLLLDLLQWQLVLRHHFSGT